MAEAAVPGGAAERQRARFRPRIATVLMIVNLAVVLLPLGSIFFLRIYENQLVQETERELIAQAAFVGAAYEDALRRHPDWRPEFGRALRPLAPAAVAGVAMEARAPLELEPGDERYRPVDPTLDLARDRTLPARPDGRDEGTADALAAAVGDGLTPVMARAQETTLAGMRLLDPAGIVVGGQAEIGLSFAHVPEVSRALRGTYASALRFRQLESAPPALSSISRGTGVRVFVALPVVREGRLLGVVYLSRTPKSVLKHLYGEREKVALGALLVLGLSASLAMLTSRTISRPVGELLARTKRIVAGDKRALRPMERPGTREIAELSEGLSAMATALDHRAEYIRTFAAHVSHEFKTPIAAIRGAVELLAEHDATMTGEERRRFLGNIGGDAARMEELLRRLLELARAENAPAAEGALALGPVLERAAAAEAREGFRVAVAVPEGLAARIDGDALGIVVRNLAENARQHGASVLRVAGRAEGGRVVLRVEDDGRGISQANRGRVFEHFFTTRRAEGGTGLGLGIVRALVEAHGGAIALAEGEGPGAAFEVRLRAG